ncbi:hypothetical protein JJJ17_19180 [Paracoccus caeni]|uniref:SH3 domain-containing protein n=1 Tax=Paracoccus caeni TaxID=657651 RepID=A0A934W0G2_9RHOB|nr:SH3 domain-containing protein [Paracoccus caeni]MBK4218057.1 hypothetical protein [Paracoccus caeni]
MSLGEYLVTEPHVSEFPNPMQLEIGDRVRVVEKSQGPDWPNWYLCSVEGQASGYVPGQILDHGADGLATIRERYTNRELTVDAGEILNGIRKLNGWLWARRVSDGLTGWVPLSVVKESAGG